MTACDHCLRRADLIAAIAGRLQIEFKRRTGPAKVLGLPDVELLEIGATVEVRRRYGRFDAPAARARASAAGLTLVCACHRGYPERLVELPDPPAVLHVLGRFEALTERDGIAVVGARRASSYGLDVARALGRGLSAAGVPVVSGLALGIDSAAHAGALEGHGTTIGVLAGSADVPYPARGAALHAAVAQRGAIVSELPPGASAHKWSFVARNRIIAALSALTVVVQAAERSGSLTTADFAIDLGRGVAAVPGLVTTRLSAGTHKLIQSGAPLVTGAADVLELLAGVDGTAFEPVAAGPGGSAPVLAGSDASGTTAAVGALADAGGTAAFVSRTPALDDRLARLLAAIEDGHGALGELAATPEQARAALAGLGELERRGLVRRGFSGRWERAAS